MAVEDTDEALIKASLRAILRSDGTSAKALAAKAQAARQLSILSGLQKPEEAHSDDDAPDPMADLDELEMRRLARRRKAS